MVVWARVSGAWRRGVVEARLVNHSVLTWWVEIEGGMKLHAGVRRCRMEELGSLSFSRPKPFAELDAPELQAVGATRLLAAPAKQSGQCQVDLDLLQ